MSTATLYEGFDRSVVRHADQPALEIRDVTLTYRELHAAVIGLAARILRNHGAPPAVVALHVGRSLGAYVGYLAALRLGAAVVPLNPRIPVGRSRVISVKAGVDVVLTDGPGIGFHDESTGATPTVITLGDVKLFTGSSSEAALPTLRTTENDVAYVLFTSGSTGRPKGVPIRHGSIAAFLTDHIARFEVTSDCRLSQACDLTFDPSVFDLFATWWSGATLVVPQRDELMSPGEFVATRRLTHWASVPSVVSVAARLGTLRKGVARTLRHSMFGGERLGTELCKLWLQVAPGTAISNEYGPTELTIACADFQLPADPAHWPTTSNGSVPIGRVYPHLEHLVLAEDGTAAARGELCIRGAQRFDGYLDKEDNAGRFFSFDGDRAVACSTDGIGPQHWYRTGDLVEYDRGVLVHLGRLDDQLKVGGHRLETGEVETAMRTHLGVFDAVVVVVADRAGEQMLAVAYTGAPQDRYEAMAKLRKELPVHLVPRRFHHFAELPLNARGKVDRAQVMRVLGAEPATARALDENRRTTGRDH